MDIIQQAKEIESKFLKERDQIRAIQSNNKAKKAPKIIFAFTTLITSTITCYGFYSHLMSYNYKSVARFTEPKSIVTEVQRQWSKTSLEKVTVIMDLLFSLFLEGWLGLVSVI